jgi:hypothetical protein
MKQKLLTRNEFREAVFKRDGYCCVVCKKPAKDAHHIIERRLWDDGGYYLDNGVSLCEEHHLKAEMTILTCEELRDLAGIQKAIVPEHLYPDCIIDKWGNPIMPNGRRLRGELFDDLSVQKVLDEGGVLNLFSRYVKYPRTYHLPWSPGATDDDRIIKSADVFKDKEVVVTIKMDGENTTMYNDYIHARSLSDKKHWSKSWAKNFHGQIAHEIPEDMRLVVENLYAKHSILYHELESYVYGISIWQNLTCLSWDESCEWFGLFTIPVVPVIYRGIWDEKKIRSIFLNYDLNEGYVVRLASSFHYKDFSRSAAKFVRKGHVTANEHWFFGNAGETNKLKA